MKKLELKHLAPYLPYDLLFKDNTLMSPNNIGLATTGFFNGFIPILRPLSDLTKEIEVDGEKFVPIKKLDYLFGHHSEMVKIRNDIIENSNWIKIWQGKSFFCINIDEQILNESYMVVEQLLKWHFDIYGLIKENLAIDINILQP